jgi:hypothetical protein
VFEVDAASAPVCSDLTITLRVACVTANLDWEFPWPAFSFEMVGVSGRHSHFDVGIAAAHAVGHGGTRRVTPGRAHEFSFEDRRKLTSELRWNGSNFDTVSRRGTTLATRGLDVR